MSRDLLKFTQLVSGQPELNVKSSDCLGTWSSATFYWLPVILPFFFLCLSQYFILSIHFNFRPCVLHHPSPLLFSQQRSCRIFSETATEPPASSASFLAGPVGPHHVLGVSLLLVMYLISHSDLFPLSFELQPTWWYGGKGGSCLLWQRTANLRYPKLRFPAKILFNLKAPIVSCRDTGNYPKHSKVNVSYLEFFLNHSCWSWRIL